MPRRKEVRGPQFVRYFGPVIDSLKALGGSGRPSEVKDRIAKSLGISDEELDETIESGASRFGKQVDWARFYLSKAGYIDASIRGVWSLTEKGGTYALNFEEAVQLFKTIHKQFVDARAIRRGESEEIIEEIEPEEVEAVEAIDYRDDLMALLRRLPPNGFESLCQELLREAGFESVTVTGKSGDGGIDGIGILQLNPLVSFKVLFQCKRYSGSLGPEIVRNFRGAMTGRADKGIILTTGTFTAEARREAIRDGAPPLELVDGEKLIDMFEDLELGLRPKRSFSIERDYFSKFEKRGD